MNYIVCVHTDTCVCEHRQYREVCLCGARGAAVRCRRGAALSLSASPFLPCEASFRPEVGWPSPAWLEGDALLLALNILRPGRPLSSGQNSLVINLHCFEVDFFFFSRKEA